MTATATHERPAPESGVDEDEVSDLRGFLRLGAAIAILTVLSLTLHIGGAVIVIASILLMIMLHEFGHFITARWADMKVTDFFVGFGPTLWSVKRGETRYGVKAFPVGGFVRVIGMNNLDPVDDPADEPRTYRAKSYWQRLRFAAAGSFMHFLIAFVLMIVLLAGVGRVLDTTPASNQLDAVATTLADGGPAAPAAKAGFKAGDKVLAIDDVQITSWTRATNIIRSSAGRELSVTVERDGKRFALPVTPVNDPSPQERAAGMTSVGRIGVQPYVPTTREPLPKAVWSAAFEIKNITTESAGALVGLFSKSSLEKYTTQVSKRGAADPVEENNRLLSPVGVSRVASTAAKNGIASVLSLLVAINVFVGIFNLIPLPPFDGGHIAVATYEAIRSRKGRRYSVDMNKLLPVAYAVILALVLLSATTLWLDIVHPFNLG
ncbi:MAG: RIP metalloprotease [Actinobacteria bacterium]|nr:RIP metalloprotease [Actinomycetota bacterium]